jgi:hypothetical protein
MPKVVKLVVALAVLLMGLTSMGAVALRDGLRRPEFCVLCHPDPYYTSWENSAHLAAAHAKAAIPCRVCHPRGVATVIRNFVVQIRGDYRLRRTRVAKEACFRCHAHASYAELIERTDHIGPETGTVREAPKEGERSANWYLAQNPHRAYHYGEVECHLCHRMHRASEDYCSECHEPATSAAEWILQERKEGQEIVSPGGAPRGL